MSLKKSQPVDPAAALQAMGLVEDETLTGVMAFHCPHSIEAWELRESLAGFEHANRRPASRYRLDRRTLWLA